MNEQIVKAAINAANINTPKSIFKTAEKGVKKRRKWYFLKYIK